MQGYYDPTEQYLYGGDPNGASPVPLQHYSYNSLYSLGVPDSFYSWTPDWLVDPGPDAAPGERARYLTALQDARVKHGLGWAHMQKQGQQHPEQQGFIGGSSMNAPPLWWLDDMRKKIGPNDDRPDAPGYVGSNFTPWNGQDIQAPDAWQAPDVGIPEAGVNTEDIVNARRHYLDENMAGNMADAARLAGSSGIMQSSDYVNSLGQAQRSRDKDLADLYYKYDYDAAQQDANRKAAARQAMLDRSLSAWSTHGGWEQGANLANQGNAFDAWQAQNDYNLQNAQDQNDFNLDIYGTQNRNYNTDYDRNMALLGMYMNGGFGGLYGAPNNWAGAQPWNPTPMKFPTPQVLYPTRQQNVNPAISPMEAQY